MKNLCFLLGFLTWTTAASAQFLLGGQFNFNSISNRGNTDNKSTTTLLVVVPRLGYVSGNVWFGLDAGITQVHDKETVIGVTQEAKTTFTTFAPFGRYIYQPVDNLGIWVEGQAGIAFGNRQENGDKTFGYTSFNIGARPGVILFIGNHLSFEASFGRLGFSSLTRKDPKYSDATVTVSEIGFSLNNNSLLLDDNPFGVSSGFQFGANWKF